MEVMPVTYEELLMQADREGVLVKEKPLCSNDGRIKGDRIAIRRDIPTLKEKACVLAEELGHYHTTAGDILNQSNVNNRKQELRARLWAYNKKIGLSGLISAYKHGCRNGFEIAEYLDVTEKYLMDAIKAYRNKYGRCKKIDNYIIFFEPYLAILESYND